MATSYELLGRRSEDMPTTMNYTETDGMDVTGSPFSLNTKGTAQTSSTVMFNPKSAFAVRVDEIIERELELSALEVNLVCVRKYKRIGESYEAGIPSAFRRKAVIVPGSYAPGNAELNSEVNIKWTGVKEHGTFSPGTPGTDWPFEYPDGEFTAETAPPARSEIHYKEGDASRADYGIFYEFDDLAV